MSGALFVTALFNGAWQGAALCAAAYALFRCLRKVNASTMFTVWSVLLGICLSLPLANYVFAARPYVAVATLAPAAPVSYPAPGKPRAFRAGAVALTHTFAPPQPLLRDRAIAATSAVLRQSWLILLLLALIALVRMGFLARDLTGMYVARRASKRIDPPVRTALGIARPYAFASSSILRSPCVLGFAPALIVIPEDLLDAPKERLLSVVLHEAEHVRRYDDVQNVAHRLVAAIAFFCPGVHIALRELALYREQICDDAAIHSLGDPVAYAMTLTSMAQWAQGRGVPVPSFIFKRKQLVRRLEMLLDRAVNHSLKIDRRAAVSTAIALVLTAAIFLRFQVPVVAQDIVKVSPAAPVAPVAPISRPVKAVPATLKVAPVAPKVLTASPKLHVRAVKIAAPAKAVEMAKSVRAMRIAKSAAIARVAPVAANAAAAPPMLRAKFAVPDIVAFHKNSSDDLLNALESAGLRNLSVDDLIKLRDYGVRPQLIVAAHNYYDGALNVDTIVRFSQYGVDASYLQSLAASGLPRVGANDVIRLFDNGVNAGYIARIRAYNSHASVDDIIRLHNSGF